MLLPLSRTHPTLASEWHPDRNTLDVHTITAASARKVWWLGKCGHEWEATIHNRANGNTGCPYCSGNKALAGFNDLITREPALAKEWHPTLNSILPSEVTPGSTKKVWWLGKCGHEWMAIINNRVNKGSGCPYCSGNKVLAGFNDLASREPSIAKEWHPDNIKGAHEVTRYSNIKAKWLCSAGHEWMARIVYRVRKGAPCPQCKQEQVARQRKATPKKPINKRAPFRPLSETHPELLTEWDKSNSLSPEKVSARSQKQVRWRCQKGHTWRNCVKYRVAGNGCKVCENPLPTHLATEWHPTRNAQAPGDVSAKSAQKVWWLGACGHEWEATIHSRVYNNASCPYCANRAVLAGFNDLASRGDAVAREWHPTKNDRKPSDVAPNSHYMAWWLGKCGHEWKAKVGNRVRLGAGCPICATKQWTSAAEREIGDYVESISGDRFTVQRNHHGIPGVYEVDILIPELKIGIEYNGVYRHSEHFKSSDYHEEKYLACAKQRLHLIQIWEDDWMAKPGLIKQLLHRKLGIANGSKIRAQDTCIVDVSLVDVATFLNAHHIQGTARGSIRLGLVDENKNLYAVAVFKRRNDHTLELLRYATSQQVDNGLKKLLDHIKRAYPQFNRIITVSDHCVNDGAVYEQLGFKATGSSHSTMLTLLETFAGTSLNTALSDSVRIRLYNTKME